MNAMKDFETKNRETEKYPDPDTDMDMDLDLEIDPDQSEASRYNEEEFLDSNDQVNEKGRDNKNRIVN